MENLKKKAFNGIIWSYIGKFGSQVIAIIPAMIMARLLGPEQYGIIAMAGIFTGIAYQLADGGFGNALVQKKNADNIDFSTVFYFNIGICGIIYTIIFFCAPFISEFFKEPILTAVIRVSSLGIIFGAFGQIQTLIFKKEISYKAPVSRNLICQLASVIVAIVMAYSGFGVWALVAQGLVQTLGTTIINWIISSWRPIWAFSLSRLKELFNYGSKTLVSSLIDYGFSKLYEIIIGRVYTPSSLGFYNRAYSTADIFKGTFFTVFSGVTFPIFVKMQDDNDRMRSNIRKFIMIVTLLIFTSMILLMILARPLFILLYSSKWLGAIALFQIACFVAMITPIESILESVILAKGHSGKFLLISIIRKILVVSVIAVVWKQGVIYLMWGQAFICICECLIYTHFTKVLVAYSCSDLFRDIFQNILIAIISVVPVVICEILLSNLMPNSDGLIICLTRMVLGVSLCAISFIVVCKMIKSIAYIELIQFLEDTIGQNRIVRLLSPAKI